MNTQQFRERRLLARIRMQDGFSIVTAIFLLVVLAGLGAAILNISRVQHSTSAMDVQGARAYQAARAGVEWGLFQQLQVGGTYCNPGPTTSSFALPAGTTLSQFTVTVVCTRTAGTIAALDRYQIIATACNQPTSVGTPSCPNPNDSPEYVQRVVQVEF